MLNFSGELTQVVSDFNKVSGKEPNYWGRTEQDARGKKLSIYPFIG